MTITDTHKHEEDKSDIVRNLYKRKESHEKILINMREVKCNIIRNLHNRSHHNTHNYEVNTLK